MEKGDRLMPVKDTYNLSKDGHGVERPWWTEQDGASYTQLGVTDETDSVTLATTAQTKGLWAPHFAVQVGLRISYSDTQKLRDHLTGILVDRCVEERQPAGMLVQQGGPEIGANEPVVTFCYFECRACGDTSTPVRDVGDNAEYAWPDDHRAKHGGRDFSFYQWSITRNTGKTRVC
jgi:hypothetical protein